MGQHKQQKIREDEDPRCNGLSIEDDSTCECCRDRKEFLNDDGMCEDCLDKQADEMEGKIDIKEGSIMEEMESMKRLADEIIDTLKGDNND